MRDRSNQQYAVLPVLVKRRVLNSRTGRVEVATVRKIVILSPARQATKLYRRAMGVGGRYMSGRQWVKARKAMKRAAKAAPTPLVRP